MDVWTARQLKTMELGGNSNARAYFQKNGFNMSNMSKIKDKYKSRQSQQYRAHLKKLVDAALQEAEAAKVDKGAADSAAADNANNDEVLSDSTAPNV